VENPHAGFPVLFNSQLRFLRLQCKAGLAHYFSLHFSPLESIAEAASLAEQ
jgi:hypothetical protein